MGISASVRAALEKGEKKHKDLAEQYGVTKQSMSTKFKRDAWFGKDLVAVAKLVGADLAFVFPDGSQIKIDTDDSDE